jgi:hypothetical protein
MWYVYVWKRPGGIPFYVGIGGTKNRWNPLYARTRNRHCHRIVVLEGVSNIQVTVIENLNKRDASRLEQTLIWYYGRSDLGAGPLTNLTDGGDGTQNITPESRKQMSEKARQLGAQKADLIRGDKNPMRNPEIYARAVKKMRSAEVTNKYSGDKNPAKRPEVRAKLKAKWQDPQYQEAQRAAKTGVKRHTEEHKQSLRDRLLDPANPMREYHKVLNSDLSIRAKRTAALQSPEVRAKISAGLKAKWAERKKNTG